MPQMVKMRATSTMPAKMRDRLSYRTRMMVASDGDEFELSARDAAMLRKAKYAEDVTAAPAAPAVRRGRPPKVQQQAAEPGSTEPAGEYDELTVPMLRELATSKGIELPSYYVTRDELIQMLREQGGTSS